MHVCLHVGVSALFYVCALVRLCVVRVCECVFVCVCVDVHASLFSVAL